MGIQESKIKKSLQSFLQSPRVQKSSRIHRILKSFHSLQESKMLKSPEICHESPRIFKSSRAVEYPKVQEIRKFPMSSRVQKLRIFKSLKRKPRVSISLQESMCLQESFLNSVRIRDTSRVCKSLREPRVSQSPRLQESKDFSRVSKSS